MENQFDSMMLFNGQRLSGFADKVMAYSASMYSLYEPELGE